MNRGAMENTTGKKKEFKLNQALRYLLRLPAWKLTSNFQDIRHRYGMTGGIGHLSQTIQGKNANMEPKPSVVEKDEKDVPGGDKVFWSSLNTYPTTAHLPAYPASLYSCMTTLNPPALYCTLPKGLLPKTSSNRKGSYMASVFSIESVQGMSEQTIGKGNAETVRDNASDMNFLGPFTQSIALAFSPMFRPSVTQWDPASSITQALPSLLPFTNLSNNLLRRCRKELLCQTDMYNSSTASDSTGSSPHMDSTQSTNPLDRNDSGALLSPQKSNSKSALELSTGSQAMIPSVSERPCPEDSPLDLPSSPCQLTSIMCPSVAIVSPTLSSPSSSEHSPGEMISCDTTRVVLTTDQPVAASLSSLHFSSELQDETDLSTDSGDCRVGESSSLPRSRSLPSMFPCLEVNKAAGFNTKRSHSLSELILDKTQHITPDIIVVENQESYRFHASQAGLFQCTVTGLVFKTDAEGYVTYRTGPWNGRLLAQLGKRPAGPLFDIECTPGSVCQLRLPHCEILAKGGAKSLTVIHVMDEVIELIAPHVITETHVIINVTRFSVFGNVQDDNSPNPLQALVLLFYMPPIDDIATLKVLLLPGNVVLNEVLNKRRSINREEIYIEKPPCELIPRQEYTLATSPQGDSIVIEPDKAKFVVDTLLYHNYIATFEVILEGTFKHVKLSLRATNISECAWKGHVCLSVASLRSLKVQQTLRLPVEDRLLSVRSSFISSISGPVLNSVLDKLLEMKVLTNSELEMANAVQVKTDKARFVIDTVRTKGTVASSTMIFILSDIDSFLSEHLGLV